MALLVRWLLLLMLMVLLVLPCFLASNLLCLLW
jgi:hypothetical protein